jgi:hypothetical protein
VTTTKNLTSLTLIRTLLLATGLALVLGACASAPPQSETPPAPPAKLLNVEEALRDSDVEITYVLGRTHRKFSAQAKEQVCAAQTFLDKQLVKSGPIEAKRYGEFLGKVSQFMKSPQTAQSASTAKSNPDSCRSPYTIRLRAGAANESVQGCRGPDEGTLAHIVRDGEFLMLSGTSSASATTPSKPNPKP